MNWNLRLGLIGQICDRFLVEFPGAKIRVDVEKYFRIEFSVMRGGLSLSRSLCFTSEELESSKIPDDWADYQAQSVIREFKQRQNGLIPSHPQDGISLIRRI